MIWYPYEQMKTMKAPYKIIKAKGVHLYTEDQKLIDSVSSWWCMIHGYQHPELTAAIQEQAANFCHVMLGGLTHEPVQKLSDKLQEYLPGDLDYCFFSDSGSVAVEVSLKMALQYNTNQGRKRPLVLALEHAYHGDTFKAMEVGDDEDYHFAFEEKTGVVHIPTEIAALEEAFEKYHDEFFGIIFYNENDYQAHLQKLSMGDLNEEVSIVDIPQEGNYLIALYLFDNTELNYYIRQNQEQKMVAGLIYLDNYDEVLESVEEVRRSLLLALIDRKISKYVANLDGITKKLEKDKYFVVLKYKSLEELEANRFSLLEEVKTVNIGNEMKVTLSIGIGVNGSTYAQNYEFSRIAIELALGRGGDQVVIKNGEKITIKFLTTAASPSRWKRARV